MNERQVKLTVGSLLHDIGKLVYRSGDSQNHSQSGYLFLKETAGVSDKEILNCVRYHHGAWLKNADIPDDSLAYITYFADNIAAAVDRREGDNPEYGFDRSVPLSSVFNILNGNHSNMHYERNVLDFSKGINRPTDKQIDLDDRFYQNVVSQITENLRGITFTEEYINSLLSILEANTTYIPSSTSKKELADISFFDHVKVTAALAECIEQVFAEKGETNYKDRLFSHAAESYEEEWFLLFSMDISGIQKFIYSIGTDGALKGLRARSFYLEFIMEHIIDELLARLELSRANLIYVGGGHSYLLLPNTEKARTIAESWIQEVNRWFMEMFQTDLFMAYGSTPCSAMVLQNNPSGSYPDLFRTLSSKLSAMKAHRYSAEDIIYLNHRNESGDRECKICRRLRPLNAEDKCSLCAALEAASGDILYQDYFVVTRDAETGRLPLPGGYAFLAMGRKQLAEFMSQDEYVRSYTKNQLYTGHHVTTKILVGSYSERKTFEEYAKEAAGINRIAVLRADVDNLGTTFVRGFEEKYRSLSRTATLSRQLSLFFKGYINYILEHGVSHCFTKEERRNAAIVYSGGDDLFLVGSWNDVIDAFIDIRRELALFTEGMLTISGGIGLYPGKYPVNLMAAETEVLESGAKSVEGKNAAALFEAEGKYSWKILTEDVIGEKYAAVRRFFDSSEERGKAFLYRLLELIRSSEEKIQYARYVYLLSRMEPDGRDDPAALQNYREFAQSMVRWYQNEEDRRKLITALYLYVYFTREED